MARPLAGDYATYYHNYITKTTGDSIAELIQQYSTALNNFYNSLPESKADYQYAPGKWTVKELLQHIIDAERVFSYRAMRIARKDTTPLPGFDENAYAPASKASNRTLQSLKDEFAAVRKATDIMLETFDAEQLNEKGVASDNPVTVNAIGFIIYGHLLHHKQILEERYLNS